MARRPHTRLVLLLRLKSLHLGVWLRILNHLPILIVVLLMSLVFGWVAAHDGVNDMWRIRDVVWEESDNFDLIVLIEIQASEWEIFFLGFSTSSPLCGCHSMLTFLHTRFSKKMRIVPTRTTQSERVEKAAFFWYDEHVSRWKIQFRVIVTFFSPCGDWQNVF